MKNSLLFTALLIVCACGTKKNVSVYQFSTPLAETAVVEVLGMGQSVPSDAKLLGRLKIGDAGLTTKCGYPDVIADAQKQARAMGGNLLQITWHKEPNLLISTCHRIKADVYKR